MARTAFLLALGLGLGLACADKASVKSGDEKPSASTDAGSASPAVAVSAPPVPARVEVAVDQAAIDAYLADESRKLTGPILESLIAALHACEMGPNTVDPECPAYQNFEKARSRDGYYPEARPLAVTVGTKLIGHEKPAVRAEAAEVLSLHEDGLKVLAEAGKTERHPTVLRIMLNGVGRRFGDNEAVRELAMASADHGDKLVRITALRWLLHRHDVNVPRAFEKALEKLENDPDVDVRKTACSLLYETEEERAVDVLEKLLLDKSLPQTVRAGCFEGIITTWTGAAPPRRPSARGYEITMKILEQQPRDMDNPPWVGMTQLSLINARGRIDFSPEWLEAVKPFFKRERFVAALESIVLDKNAHLLARGSALEALQSVHEKKASFEALARKLAGGKGQDADVWEKAKQIASEGPER